MLLPARYAEFNSYKNYFYSAIPKEINSMGIDYGKDDRVVLVRDEDMWRDEAGDVASQKLGLIPTVYHLYFDGEWVCRFKSGARPEMVMVAFWSGISGLVNENKVILNIRELDEAIYERDKKKADIKKKKDLAHKQAMESWMPEESKMALSMLKDENEKELKNKKLKIKTKKNDIAQ